VSAIVAKLEAQIAAMGRGLDQRSDEAAAYQRLLAAHNALLDEIEAMAAASTTAVAGMIADLVKRKRPAP
jgi:hypothetical protein